MRLLMVFVWLQKKGDEPKFNARVSQSWYWYMLQLARSAAGPYIISQLKVEFIVKFLLEIQCERVIHKPTAMILSNLSVETLSFVNQSIDKFPVLSCFLLPKRDGFCNQQFIHYYSYNFNCNDIHILQLKKKVYYMLVLFASCKYVFEGFFFNMIIVIRSFKIIPCVLHFSKIIVRSWYKLNIFFCPNNNHPTEAQ